jgi:predicted nuclease of restriction endonuclease-like (RecB) superfamily
VAAGQKWTSRELERQINGALFERVVLSPAILSASLRELHPEAVAVFKDTYLIEFLDLPPEHSEADLQRGLVEKLKTVPHRAGPGLLLRRKLLPAPSRWAGL